MKVNWINEKETLEKLIKEGVSYERIGRQYGVTGAAVKKAAKKMGIKPIIGCEMYMAARTRFDRDGAVDREHNHLVLLAKNEQGYKDRKSVV